MARLGDILGYFGIMGSTAREVPGVTVPNPANYRRIRTDDDGHISVVPGGGGAMLIAGVAGDDTTENPFRQVDFTPQAGGFRQTLTGASQELGPLTVDKTYQITASVDGWILVGATGGTAVEGNPAGGGSTHVKGGATYEYVAKAGALYVQFVKDSSEADGYIAISRMEV